jgi:hypothetical protein
MKFAKALPVSTHNSIADKSSFLINHSSKMKEGSAGFGGGF